MINQKLPSNMKIAVQEEPLTERDVFDAQLKKKFKIKFNNSHLRFFSSKDANDENKVYIYILTNR